ncbi:MAG: hypothetical protein PVH00_12295 [Gemmatimonadota bacterium]|jgi:hypothetical protein
MAGRPTRAGFRLAAFLVGLFVIAPGAHAQSLGSAGGARPDGTGHDTPGAFAIEAAGGAIGSAVGFGLGVLMANADTCDNEDLRCILEDVAVALGGGTIGAGLGAWAAGKLASTRPSGIGAALGSLAGAVAGLGVVHVLTEELDADLSDAAQLTSFVITQGMVTALGSRLIAALRN